MTEKTAISLKDHLVAALKAHARGKRAFEVTVLRSQPKRSYALFPWASDASVKIYVEYELLLLSEKTSVPSGSAAWVEWTWQDSSTMADGEEQVNKRE